MAARSGAAESHDRVALGSGATVKHVASLNLVSITVNVTQADAATANNGTRHPIVIRILSEDGKSREFARAHGATGTFRLPPARYRVEAEVMGLNVKSLGVIDLTNGRGGNVQLKFEEGEVSVDAGGGAGRRWRITDNNGRTVMHSGRSAGAVRLAPGRYVLLSDSADARTEQAFDLKSGERRQISVGRP